MKYSFCLYFFSNPSYYYNYDINRKYDLHQQQKFCQPQSSYCLSDASSGPPEQSSKEEWQIINEAFVQSKKNTNNYRRSNFPYQRSHQSSFSSDQQKDQMMMNPDRSLKMQKQQKKSNQIHQKNKSLSSPMSKGSFHPIVKKQSNKTINSNQMNPKSKLQKFKKQKTQKQKKNSNGSLSTNYTKAKPKKSKPSKKNTYDKHLQKSTISQKSNQFLVLGEELYDYEDMSKIQTKGFLPVKNNLFDKDINKKVTFSYYENQKVSQGNANPIASHLSSFVIYDENKFNKKLQNTLAKIQKYTLGFLQAQGFQEAKQEALCNTEKMSLQAKLSLYNSLLNDTQLLRYLQCQNKQKQIEKIDDVIKLSINKVERKSQKLLKQYQQEQPLISKWKNSKLHQLSTAKKILQKFIQDQNNQFEKNKWQAGSDSSESFNSEIDALDEENDPILILQKELQSVMNEEYYPQMKKQTINLRRVLNELLKNEQFPEPKQETQSQVTERVKMEDTKNYFTPNGVLWFFEKFFNFIVEKPNYIEELVQKLNEGYGFDVETKKQMARTKDFQSWYDFFGSQENVNHKPLIEDEVFRQFEESVIVFFYVKLQRPDPQIGEEMFVWMHHFNKAIIDCFNEQFHRFRPFYPYGQPVPYLQKAGKYFEITSESIHYFFQKCKFHVYTNYITFFAGLILPEGHEESKETKKYNLGKQVKALNQEILYDWENYHCLQTVAKMSTLESLYEFVQKEIYFEMVKDLIVTTLKGKR